MNPSIITNFNNSPTQIFFHGQGEIMSDHMIETNHFFEINFLTYIFNNHNKQKGIIDIGANFGNHSLFFAKFLECDVVHSFEPIDINFTLLQKNMQDFEYKSKLYNLALSNKMGHMDIYNSQENNFGGFSLHSYSNGSSFLVGKTTEVITLDSLNLDNITMIKIDVENHENEVLEGSKNTIIRNKPIIFIENLFHGYPHMFNDPNPHFNILNELNYIKVQSNIVNSLMDLWIPNY